MRQTFLLYLHQFKLLNVNVLPSQIIAIVIYVNHMIVTMLVLRVNLLVLKLFVNLYVLRAIINLFYFLMVYKTLYTSNTCISKTVRGSVNCKSASALISSKPVKSFVTSKLFVLVMLVWLN